MFKIKNLFFLTVFIVGCDPSSNTQKKDIDLSGISSYEYTLDKTTQKLLEQQVDDVLNPKNLDKWMKHMSSKPHHGGSPWSKQNAEYATNLFESWGFEAYIDTFRVLLPYPKIRKLDLISPKRVSLKLQEPPVKGDESTFIKKDLLPPYNAFSADGNVTAELVFVNYGIPADYVELERMGIDVKGKIVLAKYGGSWRGIKPKVAYEKGAIGCIMYSDPKDDGYFQGDVYPEGPYRNEFGVQRGSVLDMPLYPGDPLTPGYGSRGDVDRLTIEEAPTIMKIPVLPISYSDALPLLESLGGPIAPSSWRGGLPLTYHIGPGPAKVNLQLEFDWQLRTVYNPVGKLTGSKYPDEWIMRGNHHDGWAASAADPISGMVSLMEEARGIGTLLKTGWRPKRTLLYAGWDIEEPGLLGSTEWVEYYKKDIQDKMVVYINTDGTGVGFLGVGGSHALEKLVNEVSSEVMDPIHNVSLQERNRARLRTSNNPDSERSDLRIYPLGAGSDYTAFVHHAGISSLNLGFGGESGGGAYHSLYDTYDHYKRFSDGDFTYGVTLAKVNSRLVLRLSESEILPYRFINMADNIKTFIDSNKKLAKKVKEETARRNNLLDKKAFTIAKNPKIQYAPPKRLSEMKDFDFSSLDRSYNKLLDAAISFEKAIERSKIDNISQTDLVEINRLIREVEGALTQEKGLPRRPWYKNMIYAPGFYTGYGVKTLPGIREGLEERKWDEVDLYILEVSKAIERASNKIKKAASLIG